MKWANYDLQTALALQSQVAMDINEAGGTRGYGREDGRADVEEDQRGRMFGSTAQEQASANLWRRGKFEVVKEQIVPWFEPMARVMRTARRKGRRAAASALRACVEGGWWTQSRRYSVGAAASDRCACGEAAGTLWHKLGECEKGEEWRTAHCRAEVLKQGKGSLWDPLYSRGVPAKPKPVREVKSWSRWRALQKGAPAMATGNVYTDGSAVGGWWRATRAAWAMVVKDEAGDTVGVLEGACGEAQASIYRAELTAVLETLRCAVTLVTIHVDNAAVVGGFSRGKAKTTRARCEASDLWRQVWHQMDELGEGVTIKKVKAHTTWWDVLDRRITLEERRGNEEADEAAKAVLKEVLREAPIASYTAQLARAMVWARWILKYVEQWITDTDPMEEAPGGQAGRGAREVGGNSMSHEVWGSREGTICRRCGRKEGTKAEGRGYRADACNGSAGGRALAHATGNRNHVWGHFLHSVSRLCMKGYSIVKRSHVPGHLVEEGREEEEEEEGMGAAGGGQDGGEEARPWMRDPDWLCLPHLQQDTKEESKKKKKEGGGRISNTC